MVTLPHTDGTHTHTHRLMQLSRCFPADAVEPYREVPLLFTSLLDLIQPCQTLYHLFMTFDMICNLKFYLTVLSRN